MGYFKNLAIEKDESNTRHCEQCHSSMSEFEYQEMGGICSECYTEAGKCLRQDSIEMDEYLSQ